MPTDQKNPNPAKEQKGIDTQKQGQSMPGNQGQGQDRTGQSGQQAGKARPDRDMKPDPQNPQQKSPGERR